MKSESNNPRTSGHVVKRGEKISSAEGETTRPAGKRDVSERRKNRHHKGKEGAQRWTEIDEEWQKVKECSGGGRNTTSSKFAKPKAEQQGEAARRELERSNTTCEWIDEGNGPSAGRTGRGSNKKLSPGGHSRTSERRRAGSRRGK